MYHYLFTNDLRISNLEDSLIEAGKCFMNDKVPSGNEDKNANNNMNTLGFYFNLTKNSKCAAECANKNVRKVVLNFIKKFQFPNPRTKGSFENSVADDIKIAPMRIILRLLYMMNMQGSSDSYLTKSEIADFIFFNSVVAKTNKVDYLTIIKQIEDYRKIGIYPASVEKKEVNRGWKQETRQVREMIKVLTWSGCVKEDTNGNIRLSSESLTQSNKADLFDILTYEDFWIPEGDKFSDIKQSYQKYMDIDVEVMQSINFVTEYESSFSRNRILFGAPGTGKSFIVNKDREVLLGRDNEDDYERVTFHPDYSYANFVGTYKPVPTINNEGKETITYEYIPGPFMRVYVNALKNSRTENIKPFLLIIEEINRANVAAVFGDVFQLLDRGENFVSEYPIQATEDIKKYLVKELGGKPDDYNKIKIPDNMFIWATMNSADQGVFPMDTAFKRRWDFTYLGIDDNDKELQGKYVFLSDDKSQKVEWNKLRKAINNFLAKEKINEDKQLGPYFISRSIIIPKDGDEIDRDKFIDTFKNKVIMYLFEDAAKQKRGRLFEGCFQNNNRYSEICKEFEAKGVGIFNHDIQLECEVEDITSNDELHK